MLGSLRAELLKLCKRPAVWVLIGVWLTLSNSFGYLFPYLGYLDAKDNPEPGETPPAAILRDLLPANLVPNSVSGYPFFAGAIVLILGVLLSGSEYGWGTLKTMLTQRPRRVSVFGSKVAILGGMAAVLVLLTYAFGALFSQLVASAQDQPANWPGVGDLLQGMAAGWLILMVWGLLGLLFGILFQGPALGVGLGLVWALVIENLVRGLAEVLGVFDGLQKAFPGVNAGSLAAALGALPSDDSQGTPGVDAVVSGGQATVVLIGYVVVFAGVAAAVLHRRDVT